MQINLKVKTIPEALSSLASEFERQCKLIQEESIRATTAKESRFYAGRISQLKTVIEFIRSIHVD